MKCLREIDPEIEASIRNEAGRARSGLELIPSENFTSLAVMQALGSVFTNRHTA